ncbi:MAG: thiol reductant ABC exporter subunit CydC [Betaproteobacteria bacterium]|nr:thiol reductant ABC exporter subunit CydC [Betaproteobacteria bacterium]
MKRKDAPTPAQCAAISAAHDAPIAVPERLPGDDGAPSDPRQARADLMRLWSLFLPYWRWMMGGAAVALAGLLANVGLLALSGWFVSAMAIAGATGAVLNYFTPAAVIRAFAITRTGGRYAERLLTHEATFRLLARLRVWFYVRLEPLAPARLQQWRAADLLSRIQADIDTLNQVYLRLFVPVVVGSAAVILITAAMAWFSATVAASTLLLLLGAGVLLPAWTRRHGRQPGAQALQLRAAMRSTVADALAGSAELRVCGREAAWHARVQRQSGDLLVRQKRLSDLAGRSNGAVGLAANLALWLAVIAVLPTVAAGHMAPADLAMLALLALAAFEAVAPLPAALQLLGEMLAAARRIFAVVDAKPQVSTPAGPSPQPRDASIAFDAVCMRYAADAPWTLQGLTVDVRSGGRLAIVGASGAGKSSLVNVLARFWDYEKGSVRLGGHELRSYTPDAACALLAVVSQDAYIFNGTVLDNLLLAKPGAQECDVVTACRAAQIHDFIMSLPDGYLTELGEGGMRFSGGQARRVALARALLKDAPILLLDEPTEGLDVATELELFDTLRLVMRGRTVLLITHRLAALASLVDEVGVMDCGRIVQRGAPASLAAEPGPFRDLQDALTPP